MFTQSYLYTVSIRVTSHYQKLVFCFRQELLERVQHCMNLNAEYQRNFQKTKEKLAENPSERQFELR